MRNLRLVIVDDDTAARRMLQQIIEDYDMGEVIHAIDSGVRAVPLILQERPDVVLIDLLMPEQDGIETIEQLRKGGYAGKFIMLSQVVNKEMVGEAYHAGIEFFIHKPINRVEVNKVLQRVSDHLRLQHSLQTIKHSLSGLDSGAEFMISSKSLSVRDTVLTILNDMGAAAESGAEDMINIMGYLYERPDQQFPPLKELYETAAFSTKRSKLEIAREIKAIEQRIRRTVMAALNNLASVGLTDYAHPKFEYYAPRFFDFQDVRLEMNRMDQKEHRGRAKGNIKKFLQVLYIEMMKKIKE